MRCHRVAILVFTKYYLPGYRAGGPIRTLNNFTDRLGDEFDIRIITLDRDAGDVGSYDDVKCGCWVTVGKARVMYLSSSNVSISKVSEIVNSIAPDVIYLNSFFDTVFTQRVLLARLLRLVSKVPVVIAPRGEFSDGALEIKRWKKNCYLWASKYFGLYRGLIWQASTLYERQDIHRKLQYVRESDVIEALNLPPSDSLDTPNSHTRMADLPLRICFLSRISPKKNLDFALRALLLVKSQIIFTIYGPISVPGYWAKCKSLIDTLPSNIHVQYAGEIHPSDVKKQLAQHDLFFFPTRGENYGHVIHEALGSGLPVLISDQTPWHDVVDRRVGWVLSLDSEVAYAQQIDAYASLSSECITEIKTSAMEYAREITNNNETLKANRRLFLFASSRNDA